MADTEAPADPGAGVNDSAELRNPKIILLCLIGFMTYAFSVAPWLLTAVFKQRALDWVNVLSAMAAGIIFSSFLLHMTPETLESFAEYLSAHYEPDSKMITFPWATLTSGGVFMLLYAVDRLLIAHHHSHAAAGAGAGDDASHHHHTHSAAVTGAAGVLDGPPTPIASSAGAAAGGGHQDHISEALTSMSALVEAREREAKAAAATAAAAQAAAAAAKAAAASGDDCAACVATASCPDCQDAVAVANAATGGGVLADGGGRRNTAATSSECCSGEDHDEADGLKAHMHEGSSSAGSAVATFTAAAAAPAAPGGALTLRSSSAAGSADAGSGETGGTGGDAVVTVAVHEHGGGAANVKGGKSLRSRWGLRSGGAHAHGHAHGHVHGSSAGGGGSVGGLGGVVMPAPASEAVVRAWVFTFAISVHALFDGLSLGAETTMAGFYSTLAAVVAHKAFDGLATGAALYPAGFSLGRASWLLGTAALMTPLGIAIGLGIGESLSGDQKLLAESIIVSLSAGSFLFIAIVELLPAALNDGRLLKTKMGAFALGFGALAVLAAWA